MATYENLVGIDFETYYDDVYSLKKLSTTAYIRDPRFQTIGVSVISGAQRHWFSEQTFLRWCGQVDWARTAMAAHHTNFDGAIMAWKYGIYPAFYIDTMGISRGLHGPFVRHDLDAIGIRERAGRKMEMPPWVKGLRYENMTPAQWQEYGTYSVNDAEVCMRALGKMLPRIPYRELELMDLMVRMYTRPLLRLDEDLCREIGRDELDRREKLLAELKLDPKTFSSADKFAALLESMGVEVEMKQGKPQKIVHAPGVEEFQPRKIPALAKTDPFMQELLESEDDTIRTLAEARLAFKSTTNLTRSQTFLALGAGGQALPAYYGYGRAHTYRPGGGDGANWTNLERTNKRNPKKGRLRKAIVAPDGYMCAVRDSSQVEARFTAWVFDQTDLVEAFAQGRDVYSEQASSYYGRPVDRKNNPDDEVPGLIGKASILGCGYGMGFLKFALELLKGQFGPPVQFTEADVEKLGVDARAFLDDKWKVKKALEAPTRLDRRAMLVHCMVADYFVSRYRLKNNRIEAGWEYLNETVIPAMAAGDEMTFGPGNLPLFRVTKDRLWLPNGMPLRYNNLRRVGKEWFFDTARGSRKLYGGKLTENFSQAFCWIIVSGQALQIAKVLPVVMMTYDEVVSVVPEAHATVALQFMGEIMKRAPTSAPGLPLASDGGIHKRYGEAKQ